MTSTASAATRPYDGPPPPLEGQLFRDSHSDVWKAKRLTMAEAPVGFYLVHVAYGRDVEHLQDCLTLGPREFAALVRERDLRPYLRSVP